MSRPRISREINMNPTIPYPTNPAEGRAMLVEPFLKAASVGIFTNYEVNVYWGNDTHYDPNMSAWMVERPPDCTKVAILLAEPKP